MGTPRFKQGGPAEYKPQFVIRLRDSVLRKLDRQTYLTGKSRSQLIEQALLAMFQDGEAASEEKG